MSDILQAHYEIPDSLAAGYVDLGTFIEKRLRAVFAETLMQRMDAAGGLLIGPIHKDEEKRPGYEPWGIPSTHHRLWAHVDSLPEPPEFILLGGPYNDRIVRTDGHRLFRMSLAPYESYGILSLAPGAQEPINLVAVYERVGDAAAYRYVRTERM